MNKTYKFKGEISFHLTSQIPSGGGSLLFSDSERLSLHAEEALHDLGRDMYNGVCEWRKS